MKTQNTAAWWPAVRHAYSGSSYIGGAAGEEDKSVTTLAGGPASKWSVGLWFHVFALESFVLKKDYVFQVAPFVLSIYRNGRENGAEENNPKEPFPSAGLESCKNILTKFKWKEDRENGYPEKTSQGHDKYWYFAKSRSRSKKNKRCIYGFCDEPDYDKGYPDEQGKFHRRVIFTDAKNNDIFNWEIEKDLNYLEDTYRVDRELYHREIQQLLEHDPNDIYSKHVARQNTLGIAVKMPVGIAQPLQPPSSSGSRLIKSDEQDNSLFQRVAALEKLASSHEIKDDHRERGNMSLSSSNEVALSTLSTSMLEQQLAQAQQHTYRLQAQLKEASAQYEVQAEKQLAELQTVKKSIKLYGQRSCSSQGPTLEAQTELAKLYQRQQQLEKIVSPLQQEREQREQRQQMLAYITEHPNASVRAFYEVVFRQLNRLFMTLSIASTQAFVLRNDTWQHLLVGGEVIAGQVTSLLIGALKIASDAAPMVSPGIKVIASIARGLYSKYRDHRIKLGAASLDGSWINNTYLVEEITMLLAYCYEAVLVGLVCSPKQVDGGRAKIAPDSVEMFGLYTAGKIIKGLLSGKVPVGLSGEAAISALLQLVSEEKLTEKTVMIKVGFAESTFTLAGMPQRVKNAAGKSLCAESLLRKTAIMLYDVDATNQNMTISLRYPQREDASVEGVYRLAIAKQMASDEFKRCQSIAIPLNAAPNVQESQPTIHHDSRVIKTAERLSQLPVVTLVGDSEAAKQRVKEVKEQKARARKQAKREKARLKAQEKSKEKKKQKERQDKQAKHRQSSQSSYISSSTSMPIFPSTTLPGSTDELTITGALPGFFQSQPSHSDMVWDEATAQVSSIELESDATWLQDTISPAADNQSLPHASSMDLAGQQKEIVIQKTDAEALKQANNKIAELEEKLIIVERNAAHYSKQATYYNKQLEATFASHKKTLEAAFANQQEKLEAVLKKREEELEAAFEQKLEMAIVKQQTEMLGKVRQIVGNAISLGFMGASPAQSPGQTVSTSDISSLPSNPSSLFSHSSPSITSVQTTTPPPANQYDVQKSQSTVTSQSPNIKDDNGTSVSDVQFK